MKAAALLACATVLCALVAADGASAQSVPDKPAIPTSGVTAAAHALTVTWTAPSNTGGTPITAYDLRYIPTNALDKDLDANWTVAEDAWETGGGALSHQITGLRDSTSHDIQVRAVNSAGDGPWSDVSMAATIDNVREVGQLNATHLAHIDYKGVSLIQRGDRDGFTFTVAETTRVWFYSTGPINTLIILYRILPIEISRPVVYDYASRWIEGTNGSGGSIVWTLEPGNTYLLVIGAFNSLYVGPVDVHSSVLPTSTSDRAMAPELTLGRPVKGNIDAPGGSSGESEYFKFTLDAPTDVWIVAYGHNRGVQQFPEYNIDTNVELQQEDGTSLATGDDGGWTNAIWTSDIRQTALAAGTYYVRVWGDDDAFGRFHGDYELIVKEFDPPGATQATATPIHLNAYFPGTFSSATDKDYYSIVVDSPQWVDFYISERGDSNNSANDPVWGAKVYDPRGNEVPVGLSRRSGTLFDNVQSLARASLLPGKNYIEVSTDRASGDYVILPVVSAALQALVDACSSGSQSDAFYTCQWHLNNTGQFSGGDGADINVEEVWATNKGEGVTIAIVDNGVQLNHEDLRDNVAAGLSHDYHNLSFFDQESGASHGTGTAGIAAARDNAWGVRGVAPRATLYSLNLSRSPFLASDMIDVLGRNAVVTGVSSNSWALIGTGKPLVPGIAWETAAEQGATTGFGGKGIVYVHSGGNFHHEGDNANLNGLANFHTSVAVCAIGYNGKRPFYSERGASLWVCAPSTGSSGAGITTTNVGNFYTRIFSGTSAAAPIVSGVVALIRAENTALTARDVKLILAASARKNDPGSSGWAQAGVKYGSTSTSDRYNYSHSYGFGAVDAGAAVELAKTWTLLPAQRTIEATSEVLDLSIAEARSDGSAGAATTTSLTLDPFVQFIEYIEVRVTSDHPSSRDLQIQLRSPSGTVSTLAYPPTRSQFRFLPDQPVAFPEGFRFGSARHVGEDAAGAWTLTITDRLRGNTGSLTSWSIKAYGHGGTPEAPPAPTATAGTRSLTVDWEAPPDPDGDGPTIASYDLRYTRSSTPDKTDPANWTEATGIGTDDTGTYEITSLGPGAQYDVQVRARSVSGVGPWSESLVVRSTLEKPFAPSLTRVAPRDMGLGAEWSAPTEDGGSEITSYDLRTIRSDATEAEKLVDSNWAVSSSAWTAGDLRGNATGLTNGVEYDVQVRAENAIGESDWSGTRTGTPNVQNTDPSFAEETTTREIAENARIGASVGSRVTATDSDRGDTLTYSLRNSHDLFEIDDRTGQLRVKAALDHEDTAGPTHTITVEVSDGLNSSDDEDLTIDDSIEVTITVSDFDEPPEIEGEATYTIEENSPKLVGHYVATDPEGTATTWLSLTGTDARFFTFDADTGELSFVDTPDYDRATNGNHDETYDVTVRAYDGRNTATVPVTVTLTSIPEGPLIEGPAMVTVNEVIDPRPNQVVAVRAYTKRDPERSATNWGPVGSSEVLSGADSDAFAFDQQTGRLTFASPPDYEDGAQYTVTLTANDGTLDGRLDITVNVDNLEERGMLTLGGVRQGANGVPLQATLTDPDIVATETWVWQRSTSRSGPWMDIANTDASSYTPTAAVVGNYLRASVTYTDGASPNETTLTKATELPTVNDASGNQPPTPPDELPQVAPIPENAGGGNVARVTFTDPESERLTYSLVDSDEFAIGSTGQITVKSGGLDYEDAKRHAVTVKAADPLGASATATLTVDVMDVNEPPTAARLAVRVLEDGTVDIDVIQDAFDEDAGDTLTVAGVVRSPGKGGTTVNDVTNDITYKPHANYHGADSFTYRVNDARTLLSNTATVTITVMAVNDAPTFAASPTTRSVSESAAPGANVGAAVAATDVDDADLAYIHFGAGAFAFDIEPDSGQIKVATGITFEIAMQDTYEFMVEADDGRGGTATVDVTITVVAGPVVPPPTSGGGGSFGGGGGGGGGGGPSGPSPSEADFEWTVKRDIEELDSGNDWPTGLWSDGATLWILENGQGADDDVYAYDPETGERLEEREFTLAETNRAPRGIWSDRETVWVSDSGRDRVFAYTLASGARDESREIELAERNADARGIWSDSETMWVLDGRRNALFAYNLGSGALLGEYELGPANGDPRDLWSDGATAWVSDHGAKRLFAYRLPARPEAPAAEDAEAAPLESVRDEEFTELSGASNNSPRGIWSDGDFMYVVDESDDRVYTYNMPDALDARLASLTLSGVDIGEFDPGTTEYEGTPAEGVTETTVEASALQRRTDVAIAPPDADKAAEGHQIVLDGISAITVTVTSADGTRTKVYRVNLAVPPAELALTPVWTAIEWPGGAAAAIAEAGLPDAVVAVYVWDEESRSWLGYFPGLEDVSGLNTLTTLTTGATYWIAVTEPVTWTVARGAQGEP